VQLIYNTILFPVPKPSYTSLDIGSELVMIPRNFYIDGSDQNHRIPCLWITNQKYQYYLLYSHGNACDLGSESEYLHFLSKKLRVNVVAYEYEGYGIHAGHPSVESCNADIVTIYRYLIDIVNIETNKIIIMGRSIGTGPSVYLASIIEKKKPNSIGALVLHSPFSTIKDISKDRFGLIGNITPVIYDNIGLIKDITCPLFLLHGAIDEIIPVSHSRNLKDQSKSEIKYYYEVENVGHNDFDNLYDIIFPLKVFLETIGIIVPTYYSTKLKN